MLFLCFLRVTCREQRQLKIQSMRAASAKDFFPIVRLHNMATRSAPSSHRLCLKMCEKFSATSIGTTICTSFTQRNFTHHATAFLELRIHRRLNVLLSFARPFVTVFVVLNDSHQERRTDNTKEHAKKELQWKKIYFRDDKLNCIWVTRFRKSLLFWTCFCGTVFPSK